MSSNGKEVLFMKKVKLIVDVIGAAAMLLTLIAGALSDKADEMKTDIKLKEMKAELKSEIKDELKNENEEES